MALQTSGAISLNDIHVEAGGTSGTQASINDADIRGLISKGSGVQMSFNEWYGASGSTTYSATITVTTQTFFKSNFTGWIGSPTPTALFVTAGTLNGGTAWWNVGGYNIKGVQTSGVSGITIEFYTDITSSSQFSQLTYQTLAGTVTLPSSAFNFSAGYMTVPSATLSNYANSNSSIMNGTITITI
tara:strand:- start:1004 stop:1561 length:558 start_codon:yes stop_codon:yes gene_type:complete